MSASLYLQKVSRQKIELFLFLLKPHQSLIGLGIRQDRQISRLAGQETLRSSGEGNENIIRTRKKEENGREGNQNKEGERIRVPLQTVIRQAFSPRTRLRCSLKGNTSTSSDADDDDDDDDD